MEFLERINGALFINCSRCGQRHEVRIDESNLTARQRSGHAPVIDGFMCPDIATMHRVIGYALDTRSTVFKTPQLKSQQEQISESFKWKWGQENFDDKIEIFKSLDVYLIGTPEEYYELLIQVIDSYCCGKFYPAMTAAGSLGERILNRLILKTRKYFKASEHYKKIRDKNSIDDWQKATNILSNWKIISNEVSDLFKQLAKYRNDSIHYNENYDFSTNSKNSVYILLKIIDLQFNYTRRKDILWVFDVPGEIWVKSEKLSDPFVKEFILPHCIELAPLDEPTAKPPFKEKGARLKPLSDEEFIEIRRSKKSPSN